jgi:hypothetical protein
VVISRLVSHGGLTVTDVPLLSGGVPDVELADLVLDADGARAEVDAQRAHVARVELILRDKDKDKSIK